MEAAIAPASGAQIPRGGYRGRGGMPMRGGFDRGRGRGGPGYQGRGGFGPPMRGGFERGRGRGGPGYQGRGGFIPRGGMPMRGARQPMYAPPTKQHTGAENNKTVSPVPTAGGAAAAGAVVAGAVEAETAAPVTDHEGNAVVATSAPVSSNGAASGMHMRPTRGRGSYSRGGGRGGYNPHTNGGMHAPHGMPGGEHGQMPMRRGLPMRSRGGYGQVMTRSPMHQHSANTQIAPVPTLKRGAPGGPPGPKRGRYEGGPYSQRPMAPKYHQPPQHVASMPPHAGYGAPHSHHQQAQSHQGYQSHDQSQAIDPYAQSYAAPAAAQGSYNGYGQSGAYAAPTTPSSGYAVHHASEYDQSQYANYNTSVYGTQQDTRYPSYGQDYTQQYGAPDVDYNSAPQADYTQHTGQQGYDERAYAAGYDPQTYQQNYSNTTGYY